MNRNSAHLLVVDDSPSMRQAICELLYGLGILAIDQAADGRVALELFKRTPYDVVITEWNTPHRAGIDLLRAIRSSKERHRTPVVLVGRLTPERVVEAIESGAEGFVAKPFLAPSLCEKVLRLVAARAAR